MRYESIKAKIASGYVLALFMLVLFGMAAYWRINKFDHAAQWNTHTVEVRANLRRLLSALQDAETGRRGYLIVGAERYLAPYQEGTGVVAGHIRELRRLTSDNPNQQQMAGMDQVALAMENIKLASTQNVAGTRQAETAAMNLHELGVKLDSLIGRPAAA